jgi:hypothetical protein
LATGLALFGLAVFVPVAYAFGLTGGGGKLGVVDPEGRMDETAAFSAHLEFEEPGSKVHLIPGVGYWNQDGVSDVNPNLDLYYHFLPEGRVTPYVGAGMGLHAYDFDSGADETDIGANLIGGVRVPLQKSHFFMEGRYVASELSQFGIAGGVTIH